MPHGCLRFLEQVATKSINMKSRWRRNYTYTRRQLQQVGGETFSVDSCLSRKIRTQKDRHTPCDHLISTKHDSQEQFATAHFARVESQRYTN